MRNKYCYLTKVRSSLPEVFFREGALKNFAKFTEKRLCWSPFFNKVLGLRLFPCEFGEIVKNVYFVEHLRTAASEKLNKPLLLMN